MARIHRKEQIIATLNQHLVELDSIASNDSEILLKFESQSKELTSLANRMKSLSNQTGPGSHIHLQSHFGSSLTGATAQTFERVVPIDTKDSHLNHPIPSVQVTSVHSSAPVNNLTSKSTHGQQSQNSKVESQSRGMRSQATKRGGQKQAQGHGGSRQAKRDAGLKKPRFNQSRRRPEKGKKQGSLRQRVQRIIKYCDV